MTAQFPYGEIPAVITIVSVGGPGPAGCHDAWCIAAPHPETPEHCDITGFTWTDMQRRLWGQPPDDGADDAWERHQDEGTWPECMR